MTVGGEWAVLARLGRGKRSTLIERRYNPGIGMGEAVAERKSTVAAVYDRRGRMGGAFQRAWAASTLIERRYNPGIGLGPRSAKAL
jgi:hypothetical protein